MNTVNTKIYEEMKKLPSNPLTEAMAETLRLLRAGHVQHALIMLDGELREHRAFRNDPKWFRMARAFNWLKNGQPKLAIEILTQNDKWKL
jgi:hypothetical protein